MGNERYSEITAGRCVAFEQRRINLADLAALVHVALVPHGRAPTQAVRRGIKEKRKKGEGKRGGNDEKRRGEESKTRRE